MMNQIADADVESVGEVIIHFPENWLDEAMKTIRPLIEAECVAMINSHFAERQNRPIQGCGDHLDFMPEELKEIAKQNYESFKQWIDTPLLSRGDTSLAVLTTITSESWSVTKSVADVLCGRNIDMWSDDLADLHEVLIEALKSGRLIGGNPEALLLGAGVRADGCLVSDGELDLTLT